MRLVKLLAYSLLGYVLYELYLGMTEGTASGSSRSPKSVSVEDAGGARTKRSVGRGVVH